MIVLQSAFSVTGGGLLWVIKRFVWSHCAYIRNKDHQVIVREVNSRSENLQARDINYTKDKSKQKSRKLKQTLTFDRAVWTCLPC